MITISIPYVAKDEFVVIRVPSKESMFSTLDPTMLIKIIARNVAANTLKIVVTLLVAWTVISFMFDTILSTLPCFAIILIGTFNDDLSDSAIKFNPDGAEIEKTKRVNPQIPIPALASAVHGIRDEDVCDETYFQNYAMGCFDFLAGCDVAGFNGLLWPQRFLAFSTGIIIFTVLTWYLKGEGLSVKTLVSLGLAFLLSIVQIFWK